MAPMSSSSRIPIVPQPIHDVGGQLATVAPTYQTGTPVHPEQTPSRAKTLSSSPDRISKLAGMRVRALPDPKAFSMRPTLPCSEPIAPPPDRDSTRVLAMKSGRAWVVFARDADGNRPPQKLVESMAEADDAVRAYRLAQFVQPLLTWLAGFLPRKPHPARVLGVGMSGIRRAPPRRGE
jgi:hypothetical protein